ncbi:hypothetical protein [Jiangella alkaliphila]|uniref:Uncharacterized protein n=1 Tax=Jiangella alkaliphila TaxID=419479 RepID=A0A1H2LF05_9ACTN|nr:hypothetical protein [Jiangella alkaliphila]SDU79422.1 hypothetical protein SAMN04488563_5993 [Jiangella alkaliphila]
MNGPAPDQAWAEMAKRLARVWAVVTIILFVTAAVVTFAWWDAQVNDLAGGPRGSFSSGAMFPWYVVVPTVLAGLWTMGRAVASGRLYARFKRQSG